MSDTQEKKLTMAGTEGTNEYNVLAQSSFGQVGYRDLGKVVRIRFEPSDAKAEVVAETLSRDAGWKQPGDSDQNRFSILLPKGKDAETALSTAFGLVKRGRPLVYDQPAPTWSADLS